MSSGAVRAWAMPSNVVESMPIPTGAGVRRPLQSPEILNSESSWPMSQKEGLGSIDIEAFAKIDEAEDTWSVGAIVKADGGIEACLQAIVVRPNFASPKAATDMVAGSPGRKAAIHDKIGACGVGGSVGQQKDHATYILIRLCHAT